jgi:hypothetical protein
MTFAKKSTARHARWPNLNKIAWTREQGDLLDKAGIRRHCPHPEYTVLSLSILSRLTEVEPHRASKSSRKYKTCYKSETVASK